MLADVIKKLFDTNEVIHNIWVGPDGDYLIESETFYWNLPEFQPEKFTGSKKASFFVRSGVFCAKNWGEGGENLI